jgi:RNA polymerase sigma-70 factor (ECF subfamily)
VNKEGPRSSISAHGRQEVDGRDQRPAGSTAEGRCGSVDDRELVLAAQNGDREAFRTLFERHHRRAYGLALGVVRHADDALDVVQEAFIKAHRHLDKFEGSASFYTWLYRIVMNLAIDHLRKQRRARPVELDENRLDQPAGGDGTLLPALLGGHPGRALLDKEIRARIDVALGELSDNHRAVLVMRELEGMSYEDMAQAMRCSKGTIMSRLFHARRNMQRKLADLVPGAGEAGEVDGRGLGEGRRQSGAGAGEAREVDRRGLVEGRRDSGVKPARSAPGAEEEGRREPATAPALAAPGGSRR